MFFDFLQEDFLLLCPAHSSVRFPREKLKSKSGKKISEDRAMSAIVYGLVLLLYLMMLIPLVKA